jgi:NADPH:quinone reductase-like Zn-dependent oxidoreductase
VRVIEIPRFGPPAVVRLADRPEPAPDPAHPRIRVHAAGVNFADLMMRMGLYPEAPPLPFVPGYEVAGTLDDGRRVTAFTRFGGYAETVTAPQRAILPLPDGMSFEEGAAIPVCSSTAWVALVHLARVDRGERVLIEHAAGGVGLAAIQIARHAGAGVFGVTGSPAKADVLKGLGVTPVLRGDPWPDGLDVILDPTGVGHLKRDLAALAPGGRLVLYGFSDFVEGPVRKTLKTAWRWWRRPRIDPMSLFHRNVGVFGLNMLTFSARHEVMKRCADGIASGVAEGWLRPRVDRVFPLEQAAAAHQWMHDRKNIGKIVLKVR